MGWVDFIFSSEGVMYFTVTMLVLCVTMVNLLPAEQRPETTEEDEQYEAAAAATLNNTELPPKQIGNSSVDRKPDPKSVQTVQTKAGEMRVTTIGDPTSRMSMLTFHDIGMNHHDCFEKMFYEAKMGRHEEWHSVCAYHIDAPGHTEGASDLSAELQASMTMETLSAAVLEVVDKLGLKRTVGFGVGAGASVMLRVSVARPSLFRGLVLVGPTLRAAQWGESLSLRAIARKLAQGGREGAKAAASAVSGFHLSRRADRGCASALAGGLQELNPRNVGAFVAAYKTRSVLQGGALKPIKQAGLRVFLAVGNCSDGVLPMVPLENRTEVAAELQRVLESSASSRALDNVNLVTVPACGHLVTREKPRELVAPLAFFLSDAPF